MDGPRLDAIRKALDALRRELPVASDPPGADDMDPWRERIDLIDRLVLELLNERSRCANAIGHIKKALGLPVYVPEREKKVIQNVLEKNPGPLPDMAVAHLFERIIDETRSLERRKYQDPDESDAGDARTGG